MDRNLQQVKLIMDYYLRGKSIYHIQSPFFYDMIRTIFDDEQVYYAFGTIYAAYQNILCENIIMPGDEFASQHNQSNQDFADFAKRAMSPIYYCESLFRIVEWIKPHRVLELGSCVGISSLSMAITSANVHVDTVEGNPFLSNYASQLHQKFKIPNVQVYNNLFDDFLAQNKNSKYDLILLDGDHQYDATRRYIDKLWPLLSDRGVIIMDDIHWSTDMDRAWKTIVNSDQIHASIESFRWGFLFKDTALSPLHYCYIPYKYKPWSIGLFA